MSALTPLPLARGDVLAANTTILKSPLANVPDLAWTKFVSTLEVQPLHAISASNALGCYAMRPRRLGDLKLMTNLHVIRLSKTNRQVWEGEFVPPLTQKKFLSNPIIQYKTLIRSLLLHDQEIADKPLPENLTRSGTLALLHHGGWGALSTWGQKTFSDTALFVERANGIF